MRRLDLVPVGLVLALAGAVGAMAIRSAGQAIPLSPANTTIIGDVEADTVASRSSRGGPDATSSSVGHVRSETRRSALAPPDFDRADVLRRLGFGASGTYILAMVDSDSGLARWPDRRLEPIRVWIEPHSSLSDWRGEYVDSARRAFERWSEAGIPVRVNFLVDSVGAEVRVLWADRLAESRIGSTRRIRDQHWWLVAGEITLALHHSTGEVLGPTMVGATAVHEAGHLLGLNHSPDGGDIMAARHHGVNTPSATDFATLRLLYSVPPGRLR